MQRLFAAAAITALAGFGAAAASIPDSPVATLSQMPVREITIFKDGHAFVLHEGSVPTDENGDVVLDYVPIPVMGTFWPYSGDKAAVLSAVTSAPRRMRIERTALTLQELLEANRGMIVDVAKNDNSGYTNLEIQGIPERGSDELRSTSPPGTSEELGQKGQIVLLKGTEGVLVLPLSQIKHVTFRGDPKRVVSQEEFRNRLTLHLRWAGGRKDRAPVGMAYLQKGIRWIPGYRVEIDGKGGASVRLQSTILNEIVDLKDATANLVIGVPSFFFKETLDPIALQQTIAQLSPYFQTDARTGFAMSNAVMGQFARASEIRGGGAVPAGPNRDLGPEVTDAEKSEDLFVFTVKNLSLRKGERMVVPVAEYSFKYRDVYTLDLPVAPPAELRANATTEQQQELARLLAEPKAMHKIRMTNTGKHPLTTAPALIVRGDQVLGQGLMTYTSRGAETDLAITAATDVRVKKSEKETSRVPNAAEFQGNRFARIEMSGKLAITNFRDTAVDLEVARYILGQAGQADHDGKVEMLNPMEDGAGIKDLPYWWSWYSWPGWWRQFNGLGRFSWKIRLEPGKSIDLNYNWRYFTQ